jgi:hypothetical protein
MDSRDPERDFAGEEQRLHTLLRLVPRRAPSSDFSARLLAATRAAWPVPEARAWGTARSDLAISAGVVVGAALLTLAPIALIVVAFVLDASVVVGGVAHACVWMVEWFNAGLSLWDFTSRVARIAGAALVSPAGTFILLGGVLTASLALAGLSRVLPHEQGDL